MTGLRATVLIAALAAVVGGPLSAYGAPQPHKRFPPLPREKPAAAIPALRTAQVNPTDREIPAPPVAPRPEARTPDAPALEDQRQHIECLRTLEATAVASLASVPAAPRADCQIAQPVSVAAAGTVRLPARPLLACTFARAFARWTSSSVAALAKHHLGQPVVSVETGPGYVCRGRNGAPGGKISEHGLGNAIDIAAFTLKDGRRIPVTDATGLDTAVGEFLAAVRTTACGYFTTVLGPGADEAHRDHLHVDLGLHGRSAQYRICQ